MERLALVSVYDKTGLEPFVRSLCSQGIGILSTGGTAAFLIERGIPVIPVETFTGQAEILDGRVKTLHPKVHGGILARRGEQQHMAELAAIDGGLIDLVVVNLYPFTQQVARVESEGKPDHESLIEYIDIGGPAMLRAAAKNCYDVLPVCDPGDYAEISDALAKGSVPLETRRRLAAKAFLTTATYDGAIARYFSLQERLLTSNGQPERLAPIESLTLVRREELRYGENPHQHAAWYSRHEVGLTQWPAPWRQLQGKELSYNNLIDAQAALHLCAEVAALHLAPAAAVIIKHTNPCGVAVAANAVEAFAAARSCDPVSAFGGIVALDQEVDEALAATILEGFVELVLAPSFSAGALANFAKKKNVRVLECALEDWRRRSRSVPWLPRDCGDSFVLQTPDVELASVSAAQHAAAARLPSAQSADLALSWAVCKHVKSNAIVVVKDGKAIGIGAGQMSRVDSARIALERARAQGHDVRGGVAASDAFLPFADTLQILNDAGVTALVQPGGSMRDSEVIAEADKRGMAMVFTGERHFRH